MCSSSSKEETKIPEATPEEKAMINLFTEGVMPQYFDEAGYTLTSTESTIDQDPEYQRLNTKVSEAKAYMDSLKPSPDQVNPRGGVNFYSYQGNTSQAAYEQAVREYQKAEGEFSKYQDDWKSEIHYSVTKKDSPEVEAIKSKYGADSQEYKDAKSQAADDEIKNAQVNKQIEEASRDAVLKYLNGDFSISEEQKSLIQENLAPIKSAVESMYAEIDKITSESTAKQRAESATTKAANIEEAQRTSRSMLDEVNKTFANFRAEVQKTSLDVGAALDAVGNQIMQTGSDMQKSLNDIVNTNKELMTMGIQDKTGEITKNTAALAASLGRSSTDPEYAQEVQTQVARQIKEGTLSLAAMQANGELSIKERTGAQLESLLLQKADLADRTGSKMEQAALQEGSQKTAIAERTGQSREAAVAQDRATQERLTAEQGATSAQIARERGGAMTSLEEQAANLRMNIGSGMPPSQIQTGLGYGQYIDASKQQEIANAGNLGQMPFTVAQYYQQDRMAQPTKTTTQSEGIGSTILGVAGAAAKIYGGVVSGGYLGSAADYISSRTRSYIGGT